MENRIKIKINILICSIILVGFCLIGYTSYKTYSRIIRDDIINISKLTATNIYSDISNEITKPIFVSLTMANDSFLKNWLEEETYDRSQKHEEILQKYLNGIKNKYEYNSVFLVSENTKKYYHFEGLNKIINENDKHDVWYYNFIKSGHQHDLDVDTDEVNSNKLSVFVNCRIVDESGKLMGVTGVGVELNKVQEVLQNFEKEFSLSAMLFSKDGLVQVHTDSRYIENENVFENIKELNENKNEILNNLYNLKVYQYNNKSTSGYLITRYIEGMDWYLLVKKDTSIIRKSFRSLLITNFFIYIIAVIFVLIIVDRIIKKNDKMLMAMAKTDLLTNLPNRRMFNEMLENFISEKVRKNSYYVFVMDVDNFKDINDNYGHLTGDKILKCISEAANKEICRYGYFFRWGGDEFSGILICSKDEAVKCLDGMLEKIKNDRDLKDYSITVSVGAAVLYEDDTLNSVIHRADGALYEVKIMGKNNYIFKSI